jgi:hypothetical protein
MIYIKAIISMIIDFFMDGDFLDDPSRPMVLIITIWLPLYYFYIANMDWVPNESAFKYMMIPRNPFPLGEG